jgi:DNA-binding NarL/FixJ family response regulator
MKMLQPILIVEDELITAESISELIQEEEYTVAGIAVSAKDALEICENAPIPPGVVICDINIVGEEKGVDLAIQLKKLYNAEIIFLTAYADNKTLQSAFATDPVMYVVKPYNDKQLLVAIQMAFHKIIQKENIPEQNRLLLTDREKEIARLVAQGLSSKQIARQLFISIETVKTHRRRMLQKNNISSFPHLVYLMNNES